MSIKNSLHQIFHLFTFLIIIQHNNLSCYADTISVSQPLSGDQTITSSGGNFKLGFFSPGKSSNHYIGIWYNKVSEQTIVWVANRKNPVLDRNSAELKIQDGNLVISNGSNSIIWSTNITSTTSNDVVAVLRDDGNLVLVDTLNLNTSIPFWQSFDNPVHTWLPGAKISFNKKTNQKLFLSSWKNNEDPAPGSYRLEFDPNGSQYIIKWNDGEQYWTSGSWNGRIFSLVPEMRLNYIYNFSYVDNVNESYFTYSLYNPSIISRFIMDVSGQIKQLTWLDASKEWNLFWSQPRQQCEVYAYCGAFGTCNQNSLPFCDCIDGFRHASDKDWNLNDYSGGCVRETPLQCGNVNSTGENDRFRENLNMVLPEHSQDLNVGNIGECESACFNNCSCTAYAFENGDCSVWTDELLNLQQLSSGDSNGRTLYIRLAASEFPPAKSNMKIIIGAVVGAIAFVLVIIGIVIIVVFRHRKLSIKRAAAAKESLVAFPYRDLQNATKNFSDKLGGGGFGSVFKGKLPDSTEIAVKKLESISQGEKQFRTEVSTIGTIQHVNLVRLRGFCSEGNKKLLVYDYMVNGSLDAHLFHEKESKVFDWKTRYNIALGTARGLHYLHEKCRDCIIHCDIKPENILLDAELCPKVADFGLAKLVGRDFSRVLTTMRGTRGYLAPEWISGVAITAKADVYSYGMMLFEFVSGKRNSESSDYGIPRFFPTYCASVTLEGGDILSLLDPRLDRNAPEDEVIRLCKVACWCIQENESIRPSMGQIVQILEGVLEVNMPPAPRNLQMFADNQENIVFFTESSTSQSSKEQSKTSSTSSNSKSSESSNVTGESTQG